MQTLIYHDTNNVPANLLTAALNVTIEGITIANSATHSINLPRSIDDPDSPVVMRWLKIFTWRGNGDGINPQKNGIIEDCFIRTCDDSTYVNGLGIRRVVYWLDSNGSFLIFSAIGRLNRYAES